MIKTVLKLATLLILLVPTACVVSTTCTKIGYNQGISEGTYFDEKNNTGYFIYSYLENKEYKNYALYKVNLNGKSEKIVDLGSKPFSKSINNNALIYKIDTLSDNKVFIQELDNNYKNNHLNKSNRNFYLVDVNSNKLIYKKEISDEYSKYSIILNNFSPNKKYLLDTTTYYQTWDISIDRNGYSLFDIEKGIYYNYKTFSETQRFDIKFLKDSSFIMVTYYSKSAKDGKVESVSIYDVSNNLEKINQYSFKENETYIFKNLYYPHTLEYKNGILEYKDIDAKNNKINTYNLDFSKNSLITTKTENTESIVKPELPKKEKMVLRASEKLYLENLETHKKEPVLDYLKDLPKGFYYDESICGDFYTSGGLSKF